MTDEAKSNRGWMWLEELIMDACIASERMSYGEVADIFADKIREELQRRMKKRDKKECKCCWEQNGGGCGCMIDDYNEALANIMLVLKKTDYERVPPGMRETERRQNDY